MTPLALTYISILSYESHHTLFFRNILTLSHICIYNNVRVVGALGLGSCSTLPELSRHSESSSSATSVAAVEVAVVVVVLVVPVVVAIAVVVANLRRQRPRPTMIRPVIPLPHPPPLPPLPRPLRVLTVAVPLLLIPRKRLMHCCRQSYRWGTVAGDESFFNYNP